MKKRKELDALVSSRTSALATRAPATASAASSHSVQELLKGNNRDSDSSDVESSYAVLASYRSGGVGTHGCSLGWAWLPLCLILLVGAAGALVWLHLGLRQDFDSLRAHLHRVDAENKHLPEALHEMHSRLQQLAQNLTSTAAELQKTSAQLASLSKEVADLKATTSSLQESVASAPQIKGLPNAVTDLKQNVANIGSQVSSLEQGVEALKEQHTATQTMQKDLDHLKELVQRVTNATSSENQSSAHSLDDLKQSMLKSAADTKQALEQRLATLEADVRGLNSTAESALETLQHQQEQFGKLDNCSRNCSDLSPDILSNALNRLAVQTTHSAGVDWVDALGQAQHLATLYKELSARLHVNESASNEAEEFVRRAALFVNETVQDALTWHTSSPQARPWTTSSHEATTEKSASDATSSLATPSAIAAGSGGTASSAKGKRGPA
ncbi:EF-hand calcium-binding domain-containing protein 14 isoform X2 [Ixodes scapularis]|uniref:EF-hand calcium-binding domain-containing protein 14 isoform X2 n=1 Tax=Ixodes scapularis TaxID=6945 RepID=UPI001A9CCAE4|nr:EF-hand calcium-binding domain-containing protein 14 isoform X2 [Ixodes scapularis]